VATLASTSAQNRPAAPGGHSRSKTVNPRSAPDLWLIGSFRHRFFAARRGADGLYRMGKRLSFFHSIDLGSQGSQLLINAFVSALDLSNVVNGGSAFGSQGC
jgi:hypothetical protein